MDATCWVLSGPTASGKTALSLRLARAHQCEIICMDSMQIYRGMDIGTAKPTAEELAQAPHHMVDVADPREPFSVARYQEMAEECVRAIQSRGHRALFVGGTGLVIRWRWARLREMKEFARSCSPWPTSPAAGKGCMPCCRRWIT